MYTDNLDSQGNPVANTIKRISDGQIIDFDITNEDYQAYLAWQSQQNPLEPWAPEVLEPPVIVSSEAGNVYVKYTESGDT